MNEKNQLEYYPLQGFPLEIFIVNEFCKVNLFTRESLNSSNFVFFSESVAIVNLAITLKKLLFIGNYTLYDHYSWEFFPNFGLLFNAKVTPMNSNNNLVVATVFLSAHLDVKITHVCYSVFSNTLSSISGVFPNAVWVERENSEMYAVYYKNLTDSRKLLLDYTSPRGVLLKEFTSVYYSHYYKNYYGINYR